MLVLTRGVGEVIMIGDDIAVEVVEITANEVTFKFTGAPCETQGLERYQVYLVSETPEIEVTLVDIRNKSTLARIGITAPKSIAVHRKEIYDNIKREIQEAAKQQIRINPSNEPPQSRCA
jgi:carbon storage regulator CsrA